MEITEKHLEEAFEKLEIYAWKEKNRDRREGIIFSASAMKDHLRCVLKAKSEEDLKFSRERADEYMRILKENNGDLLYYRYNCGHGVDLNITADSLLKYIEWKENHSGLCFACWLGEKEKDKDKKEI